MEADREAAELERLLTSRRAENAGVALRAKRERGIFDQVVGRWVPWNAEGEPELSPEDLFALRGRCESPVENEFYAVAILQDGGV